MKLLLTSILFASLMAAPAKAEDAATPDDAQDIDLSKTTCKQFISAKRDTINTIMIWLEGFYTDDNSPAIMYAAKRAKDAKNLTDYCNAHGDDNVITAADAVIPVE